MNRKNGLDARIFVISQKKDVWLHVNVIPTPAYVRVLHGVYTVTGYKRER